MALISAQRSLWPSTIPACAEIEKFACQVGIGLVQTIKTQYFLPLG